MKELLTKFFKRNPKGEKPADSGTPTLPGYLEAPRQAPSSEARTEPIIDLNSCFPRQCLVGTGQSVGRQRDHNEDALYALNAILSNEGVELPFGIFVVADGMGGHQHGELASQTAIRTVTEHLMRNLYFPLLGSDTENQISPLQDVLKEAFLQAQKRVTAGVPGGGTTLTVAVMVNDQITVAHVGDSRAYFVFPDHRIEPITKDHSLVQRLVDLKQITAEEAFRHPQKNMLYQAIGQSEPIQPEINTFSMPNPGFLMVCSDGLWGVIPDKDMERIISSGLNPSLICKNLVRAANEGGGPDNISVVLVQGIP